MSAREIEAQAKLIAALADTMKGTDWSDDIFARCRQIEEALAAIRRLAHLKAGGER